MFNFKLKSEHGYQLKMDKKIDMFKARFGNKYYMDYIKEINSTGYMSEELGKCLEELYQDVGYIGKYQDLGYKVGVHLTGYTQITEEFINDVFENGLINNGHVMSGGATLDYPDITLTVTLINNLSGCVHQLKNGNGYKGSRGSFILKFPSDKIDKIEELEYFDGNIYRIYPEYIYGFVSLSPDCKVGDLIKNPNFSLDRGISR